MVKLQEKLGNAPILSTGCDPSCDSARGPACSAAARQHNPRQSPSRPRTRRHLPAVQATDDDTAHQGVTHHVLIDTVEVRGSLGRWSSTPGPSATRTSTASLRRGTTAILALVTVPNRHDQYGVELAAYDATPGCTGDHRP